MNRGAGSRNQRRISASTRRGLRDEAKAIRDARARCTEPAARKFFDGFTEQYESFGMVELELIVRCAQATARVEAARAVVKKEGMLVTGERGSPVRHPALMVERGALAELRALLRELRLSEVPE